MLSHTVVREQHLCGFEVPHELKHVIEAIEKSKNILELPDNWDGEGSPAYSKETWERAVRFLLKNAITLFKRGTKLVDAPAVYHGPEGSIDIYWENNTKRLLINIPPDPKQPGSYYGSDVRGYEVKGLLDTSIPGEWLLMWQME